MVYKHENENWMNDVEGSRTFVKEFAARRKRAKGWMSSEHIIHNHDLLAELVRRDPIRYG